MEAATFFGLISLLVLALWLSVILRPARRRARGVIGVDMARGVGPMVIGHGTKMSMGATRFEVVWPLWRRALYRVGLCGAGPFLIERSGEIPVREIA